jgi:hypothetical protein
MASTPIEVVTITPVVVVAQPPNDLSYIKALEVMQARFGDGHPAPGYRTAAATVDELSGEFEHDGRIEVVSQD